MAGKPKTLSEVKNLVADRVTPDTKERMKVKNLSKRLVDMVSEMVEASGIEGEVALEGSVAKDTWLRGEADVDVFLLIPASKDREYLEKDCIAVIRKALQDYPTVERYAEHPYLEAFLDGIRVNVVPCFKVEEGKWRSAADRTPFHTAYMNETLTETLRREVKILKRFMKGCNLYGAEVKVKGFSGFLCEILTLNYGSFEEIIAAASKWRRRELIDVKHHFKGRERYAQKVFPEPLIAVDPVDPGRNAAAAVSEDAMWSFVSASRLILRKPRITFFYPKPFETNETGLRRALEDAHGDILAIDIGETDAIVDVLWSQLYKAERILRSLLERRGFKVIRSVSWSNEENRCIILIKLQSATLPPISLRLGPPVEMGEESKKFLNRRLKASHTDSGPWIRGGRWTLEETRKETSATELIEKTLLDGGSSIGMPSRISLSLKKGFKILLNQYTATLFEIPGAAEEIHRFITGRPIWLEAALED